MTGKHGTGSSCCVLTESNSKHCNNERSSNYPNWSTYCYDWSQL